MASITVSASATRTGQGADSALATDAYNALRLTLGVKPTNAATSQTVRVWVESSRDNITFQPIWSAEFTNARPGGWPQSNTFDLPALPAAMEFTRLKYDVSPGGSVVLSLTGVGNP